MQEEDLCAWIDALQEFHAYCHWFRDKEGILFSFKWYSEVKLEFEAGP